MRWATACSGFSQRNNFHPAVKGQPIAPRPADVAPVAIPRRPVYRLIERLLLEQPMETASSTASRPGPELLGWDTPEQEAAFFFGLFLRGSSYQQLRQDIEVPAAVELQWRRTSARDPNFASVADQMLAYRRRVLAIFQALVATDSARGPQAVQ